ncbi:MAG TPA: flagellar biosynthetic protein FliO [Planctomycetota bacterium]|nr:flagellar biosynthetic protein FliO [Planctomycetota bacterium]
MGLLAMAALLALGLSQDAAPEAADVAVSVPPAQAAPVPPPPVDAAPAQSPAVAAIPAQDPPRAPRPLEDRPESGPSVAGFILGSIVVVGLLGGSLLVLRRFGRNSRFLGNGGPIRILARKPIGPRQDLVLVEVGARVLLVGATREHLSALGEITAPDELAALRAGLPERRNDAFRETLKEGIREGEHPKDDRVFASIADELAEIRKTVRAWRG